jgi:pimeloyl-ACP methyl ester carboxylesterase
MLHTIRGNQYYCEFTSNTSPDNPPLLVFIPGFGGSTEQFLFLKNHFEAQSSILSLDLLGFGKSKPAIHRDSYQVKEIALDIALLIQEFQSKGQTLVVNI